MREQGGGATSDVSKVKKLGEHILLTFQNKIIVTRQSNLQKLF